ncbi:MAG TPA: hypothetical protein VI423_05785, partial [Paenisporosarcina sp.]|nr:hypothetical protein [Paenisporosarcina sp.]
GTGTIFSPGGVVIPDCRFVNEVNAIKKVGGKVVRIYREIGTTLSGAAAQHLSETEQKEIPDSTFDYILYNVDDSAQLDKSIEEMMSALKK